MAEQQAFIEPRRAPCGMTFREVTALARAKGWAQGTLWARLSKLGWSLERALTEPLMKKKLLGPEALRPRRKLPRRQRRRYTPGPVEADNYDLRADLLAGESSARILAERYGVAEMTIVRARARLRAQGFTVRVPEGP